MSSTSLTNASYYFWKWADNDVSGPPDEVYASLLRGNMHDSIQPFDARALLHILGECKHRGAPGGEEWDWEVHPPASPEAAAFVFVCCPQINSSIERVKQFMKDFVPLELSGWDERERHLIWCLAPKTNCVILGQFPYEQLYEITTADLSGLLLCIDPDQPEAWLELMDRRHGVFARAEDSHFRVDWRERRNPANSSDFSLWRAGTRRRRNSPQSPAQAKHSSFDRATEHLNLSEALSIFEAFFRGSSLF